MPAAAKPASPTLTEWCISATSPSKATDAHRLVVSHPQPALGVAIFEVDVLVDLENSAYRRIALQNYRATVVLNGVADLINGHRAVQWHRPHQAMKYQNIVLHSFGS
jgi:hypothetical protein